MRISSLVLAALLGAMTTDQVAQAVELSKHHKKHHHHKKHEKAHVQTHDSEDVKPGHAEPGANAEEAEHKEDPDDVAQQ